MREKRFPEIDVVRGAAILGMISFHVLFDLALLGLVSLKISGNRLEILAEATAATFFVLVGASLYISYLRRKKVEKDGSGVFLKYAVRGLKLLGWGLVVSGVTYAFYPAMAVAFGALHFIGVSVFLGYLLLKFTRDLSRPFRLTVWIGGLVLLFYLSGPVKAAEVGHRLLLPLGLAPSGFQSLDYFPLLPWFGYVVGGIIMGELLYPGGRRASERYAFGNRTLEFLGRNSLWIYFLHQPLILLGIYLFLLASGSGPAGPAPFNF